MEKKFSAIEVSNLRQLIDTLNNEGITKEDIVQVFTSNKGTIVVLFYA